MRKSMIVGSSVIVGIGVLIASYAVPAFLLGRDVEGVGETVSIVKYQNDLKELKERGNDNLDKFGERYAITPSNVFDNNIIRQVPELDENGKPIIPEKK